MIEHVAIIASGFEPRAAEAGWGALRRLVDAAPALGIRRLTIFLPAGAPSLEAVSAASIGDALAAWRDAGVSLRLLASGEGAGIEALRSAAGGAGGERMELLLLASYDGRKELADAARALIASGAGPQEIDDAALASRLYYPDLPEVDLLILTGGERRLGGSLLWEIAYAELYFSQRPWNDAGAELLQEALAEFARRVRKFGAIEE